MALRSIGGLPSMRCLNAGRPDFGGGMNSGKRKGKSGSVGGKTIDIRTKDA